MIQKILLSLVFVLPLIGLELSSLGKEDKIDINTSLEYFTKDDVKVFGHNLFNGSFSKSSQLRYDSDYLINIGDTINVKLWGAFEIQMQTKVDMQGNIFIPKVGVINILGIKNNQLSKVIEKSVKRIFRKSVFVYADLANYQPVNIFVTGAVNKPGLYEGLSSDSIIQFLDKARGINAQTGSYRSIKILRQNKTIREIDLYDFLLEGSLELFQFHMGDVIVVDSVKNYVDISGDVKRPYRYEIKEEKVSLREVLRAALVNPSATNFVVTEWNQDNTKDVAIYPIRTNLDSFIDSGNSINFIPDHIERNIVVSITGEHTNIHNIVVDKGTTLEEVLKKIKISHLSQKNSFQLFRKSVAEQQKVLLHAQLKDLEVKTLTAGSQTTEEAIIRKQEAALVMNFIQRAKAVELKGKVVINEDTDLSKVLLEDGDEIYIPKKSHMVIVEGEVLLPNAQTYVEGMQIQDYINSCGGYSFKANEEEVLLIKKNGKVINLYGTSEQNIEPGDSILVLSKIDSKSLNIIKDITQIIYQLALGAAVILRY